MTLYEGVDRFSADGMRLALAVGFCGLAAGLAVQFKYVRYSLLATE